MNIKALTLDQAKKIYYQDFWIEGRFEEVSDDSVAAKLLDLSVNLGIRTATIVLQRALRSCDKLVSEDGLIGPETLSAVSNSDPNILSAAIKSEAAGYYRLIATKNPNQKKFLNGWLNRAYRKIVL